MFPGRRLEHERFWDRAAVPRPHRESRRFQKAFWTYELLLSFICIWLECSVAVPAASSAVFFRGPRTHLFPARKIVEYPARRIRHHLSPHCLRAAMHERARLRLAGKLSIRAYV